MGGQLEWSADMGVLDNDKAGFQTPSSFLHSIAMTPPYPCVDHSTPRTLTGGRSL